MRIKTSRDDPNQTTLLKNDAIKRDWIVTINKREHAPRQQPKPPPSLPILLPNPSYLLPCLSLQRLTTRISSRVVSLLFWRAQAAEWIRRWHEFTGDKGMLPRPSPHVQFRSTSPTSRPNPFYISVRHYAKSIRLSVVWGEMGTTRPDCCLRAWRSFQSQIICMSNHRPSHRRKLTTRIS